MKAEDMPGHVTGTRWWEVHTTWNSTVWREETSWENYQSWVI